MKVAAGGPYRRHRSDAGAGSRSVVHLALFTVAGFVLLVVPMAGAVAGLVAMAPGLWAGLAVGAVVLVSAVWMLADVFPRDVQEQIVAKRTTRCGRTAARTA